jgi:hypothetical protein
MIKRVSTNFSDLLGERIISIEGEVGSDVITFVVDRGWCNHYQLYHDQDCCESVTVEDIVGDLQALVGNVIVMVSEEINVAKPARKSEYGYEPESYTWTFYKLADDTGSYVTIRWFGESNGYHSERVSFARLIEVRE